MLKLTATWRRVQLFCSFKGRVNVQNPRKYHSVWKHREMRSTACTNMDTRTQRDAAFLWIWSIIMIHLLFLKSIYSVLSPCNAFTLLAQIFLIVLRGYFFFVVFCCESYHQCSFLSTSEKWLCFSFSWRLLLWMPWIIYHVLIWKVKPMKKNAFVLVASGIVTPLAAKRSLTI